MDIQAIIITTITSAAGILGGIAALRTNSKNKNLTATNDALKVHTEKLEVRITEIKLITSGMAVAYLYNFIDPLFVHLENPEVRIKDKNGNIVDFHNDNLTLKLYIPHSLDAHSLTNTRDIISSLSIQCDLISKEEKVVFRNLYYRLDKATNNTIVILDLPNILDSAVKYYRPADHEREMSDETADIIRREINNFCCEIESLVKKRASLHRKIELIKDM